MPPRGSLKQAREFAQKHGAWIAARLERLPEAAPFADGAVLPLRGVDHRIVHRRGARGTVWIETGDDGERLLCVAGAAPHIPRRVRDFLKREAKRDLEAASRRAADALGVTIKRVSIRDQSSRWGSCSTTGVLSYSWRLILAPPFVLDYLAAHEVAHLIEMNHSPSVLAAGRAHLSAHEPRQDLARRARHRAASLRVAGRLTPAARSLALARSAFLAQCAPVNGNHKTHAASRHFRAHGIAGGVERDRAAHHRYVPAVAAGHRAPARRLDRAGAAHHFGLSDRLRGRADLLRPDVRPARPQAGAAGRRGACIARRAWPARCRPRSRC